MNTQTPYYDLLRVPQAAARNREPVLNILKNILPESGTVLEIGSGSGAHSIYFAGHMPHLTFQPSERETVFFGNIENWINLSKLRNIKKPVKIDLLESSWPPLDLTGIFSINVAHIAPWPATVALIEKAGNLLEKGAPLYFYGPFFSKEREAGTGNISFDQSLREEHPQKGIRHIEEMTACALKAGFKEPDLIDMPSNNLSVIFRKA